MAEADDPAEADRLRYEIEEPIATGRALSSERDTRKRLSLILRKCREALAIIESEVNAGKLDGPLFEIFVKSETYKVAL